MSMCNNCNQQMMWRTNMLMGMLCLGDDLLTLTSVQMPPDDGTVEDYKEVVYRLTHTDLQSGQTKFIEIDGENDAVLALAAWAASESINPGDELMTALERLQGSELADTLP